MEEQLKCNLLLQKEFYPLQLRFKQMRLISASHCVEWDCMSGGTSSGGGGTSSGGGGDDSKSILG